ncbi:UDP-glucose--hexose-1-phosphate uridylyltransferase [Paramaledivibacter caminithermalis]|jgi:UDPglucose--hexose-1-phosphate uridylyltransferase|uniref:Galactose-1-phosphate uridylyltransferase n=1 Tax=Paramaledivibacter caminithermalis (strain DSM 15212 / CIP 107654 / DViRD3) TaxID=1121301 RepID=A0A1M6NPB8_PARC5|nr:UDP-glucose--hexose-1-phosphate uridylyltransferase [Paramaledivibacter caminithermalis]SHJ97412.1 UTP-hexose-1-phosphate uridylyltransferase [Paramaledivibacter caminithermalis DSM 15212]
MSINIYLEIERLIKYALNKKLIRENDVVYSRNLVLEVLGLDDYKQVIAPEEKLETPSVILDNILAWAYETGKLQYNTPVYRDLLDTKIMNCFMPRPSEVVERFYEKYNKDPEEATKYYYDLSKSSNYIRVDRVEKNIIWKTRTKYGYLDITINLSKPEKDPKDIAAAKNIKLTSYPKCLLCRENEGYAGRVNHPARQNHRVIPLTLKDEEWFLQYSPYVYYNEHSIIFKGNHEPMKISKLSFDRLLEFIEKFPHYFIGSNADLPIVGGSILSHDHFQGGNYEFAMAKAAIEKNIKFHRYPGVEAGIVKWPMSVIRLKGKDQYELAELAELILNKWKNYNDDEVHISSHTKDIPHNTITPIARRKGKLFELDLVLRNNRTNEEYPLGIFHPHDDVHHIKKENIGLIEVMGLAVLPARLKDELDKLAHYLLNHKLDIEKEESLKKHMHWFHHLRRKYSHINESNVHNILKEEIGQKFMAALEHAGVFKDDNKGRKAFIRFLESIND